MLVEIYMDERVDRVLDTQLGSQGDTDEIHDWVQKATKKRRGAKKVYTLGDLISHHGKGF